MLAIAAAPPATGPRRTEPTRPKRQTPMAAPPTLAEQPWRSARPKPTAAQLTPAERRPTAPTLATALRTPTQPRNPAEPSRRPEPAMTAVVRAARQAASAVLLDPQAAQ